MRVENVETIRSLLARKHIDWGEICWLAEVGSTAHGLSTAETGDDHDYTAVRIEPFEELVVGNPKRQSMMLRTQPEGVRSEPGDVDLQVYTLRKFARLLVKGNPSILAVVFSQQQFHRQLHKWVNLDDLARIATSQAAGSAFLGYMRQQIERWIGIRGQKNVSRPELVERFGFDTKYAAHVIRLGHQGIEYMTSGRFTMPMPEPLRSRIVGLRTGAMDEYQALEWAKSVEDKLRNAIEGSLLPERPDVAAVDRWLVRRYGRYSLGPWEKVDDG